MPGMVADLTGSYAPAYVIFAPFGVFSILTVQSTYGSEAKPQFKRPAIF